MKALVLTGIKQMEVQNDYQKPTPKPNEVLIHTAYVGICGTDKGLYNELPGSADAVPPIVLGHENSGVVAAVGSEVTGFKPGDRVSVDPNIYCHNCFYCRTSRPEFCEHLDAVGVTRDGGFEEFFTAPAEVVYHIPDNVSLKAAAVIEPISCAMHAIDLLELHHYQNALIIGAGFEGILMGLSLQSSGVREVTMAARNQDKLNMLHDKFGFQVVNNKTNPDDIKPESYDIVIESVSAASTQEQAVEAARRGGQVLMFGVGNPDSTFTINSYKIFQKQLKIQGSFINPYTFEDSIGLLQSGDVDPLPLMPHELDLSKVEDFVSGKLTGVTKAIVKVGGDNA